MKNIIALLVVAFLALSCSRTQTAEISGTLLFSCDNPYPLEGTEVYFSSSGGPDKLSAVVDSTGYFEIIGEFTPAGGYNWQPYSLYIENGATFAPTELASFIHPITNLDTLYLEHKAKVIITVTIDSALVLTNQDTIWFDSHYSDDFRIKRYPGPFQQNQVIDTFDVSINPHTNYPIDEIAANCVLIAYHNNTKDTAMSILTLTGQRINYCGKFLSYEYHIK